MRRRDRLADRLAGAAHGRPGRYAGSGPGSPALADHEQAADPDRPLRGVPEHPAPSELMAAQTIGPGGWPPAGELPPAVLAAAMDDDAPGWHPAGWGMRG